mgnify:CR=1 FL=1
MGNEIRKFTLILITLFGLELSADYVKNTAAACSSEETITALKEQIDTKKVALDGIEMELWLMKNDCKVIDKKTQIEVLDYTGKKKKILKIKLKKTGEVRYGLSKAIQIEQPGQKNVIHKF